MEINKEKRESFMKNAEGRVNKVINFLNLLKDMSKSSVYDYSRQDVEEMFNAIQNVLDNTKEAYLRKFEEKQAKQKVSFSFGALLEETKESSTSETSLEHTEDYC